MGFCASLRRLNDSLAGPLCYLPVGPIGVIASLVFLFMEPYRRNRFVRFHAVQSIMLAVISTAVIVALLVLSLLFIGILAPLALVLLVVFPLLGLAIAHIAVVLMIKANTGEMLKLPFIGDFAARHAGTV
jgi:uncharacterized membrane protein